MISDQQRPVYIKRIDRFIKRMCDCILADHISMEATFRHGQDSIPFAERLDGNYVPITEGQNWGDAWDSAWFHLTASVPAEWAGQHVVASLDFNGEALVFSNTGVPLQGLTNGSVFKQNFARTLYPLLDSAGGGEAIELWVEAAANGIMGLRHEQDPPRNCPTRHGSYVGQVNHIRLCIFNEDRYRLWLEYDLLFNLLEGLPKDSVRAARIFKTLSDGIDLFADNPEKIADVRALLAPLLEQPAHASTTSIHAVGHAHIDTAWLWPVRETIRKNARTFSSQLALIEAYDDYVFGASQPALYKMVKVHYPELYAKIRDAVKGGRWEPQGGMWVEADCNITSGESLVRQFVHGKNFFMDEFGFDVQNLWIPDVFGYSAAMPQIMKRSGVDYFLTQKLSWSQFNTFPYTTFRWRGIDGTEVLTHFPPENTYNSMLQPRGMQTAERNFQEKDLLDDMMVLFGVGDGGGGPTRDMIERGRLMADLEGVPRLRFGRADAFFEKIAGHTQSLPLWVGELYLELHRGTLTTQARTKRGNRLLEQKLRETEYILSCAALSDYPREDLDCLWKTLLLNQFHDILPGSSIHEVYEVAEKEYAAAMAACDALQATAAARIFHADEDHIVLVNTLNTPYTRPVLLPADWDAGLVDDQGEPVPVQKERDGSLVAAVDLPAQGMLTLRKSGTLTAGAAESCLVLENDLVRYVFSDNGEIIDATDKEAGRAILAVGEHGNVLTLYEDRPTNWDAWDIDIFYENQALETARPLGYERLANGPVRQGICFTLEIGRSKITQKVTLAANCKRLDFDTKVLWNERHRMLRTAFPTTIQSEQASFDIQYGYVQRNTHRNVSWDMARFEVAAHKYMDLSDKGYGVALLNDCKYGHKVLDGVLDLNLLRAPTYPDPEADLGDHCFSYSLLPHCGSLIESNVIQEATQLNQPPACFPGCAQADANVPVRVAGDGVGLEVLKKAEKDDCLVIRLVEKFGRATSATVTLTDPGARLVETNLLEWTEDAEMGSGTVCFPMRAFDIRTFKVRMC